MNMKMLQVKFRNSMTCFNLFKVFISTTHPSSSIFPAIGRFRNLNFAPDKPNESVGLSPPIAARINQHVIAEGFDISPEYELSLDASFYRKGSLSTIWDKSKEFQVPVLFWKNPLRSDPDKWSNVIHVTAAGWGSMGTRNPSGWFSKKFMQNLLMSHVLNI